MVKYEFTVRFVREKLRIQYSRSHHAFRRGSLPSCREHFRQRSRQKVFNRSSCSLGEERDNVVTTGTDFDINARKDEANDVVSIGAAVYLSGALSFLISRTFAAAVNYAKTQQSSRPDELVHKVTATDIFGGISRDLELKQLFVKCLESGKKDQCYVNEESKTPLNKRRHDSVSRRGTSCAGVAGECSEIRRTYATVYNYDVAKLCRRAFVFVVILCWFVIFLK